MVRRSSLRVPKVWCEYIGTGGETADVGDLVRTIIVDSTVVARMKRNDVVDNANIKPGNVIVGLASFGQAIMKVSTMAGWGRMD